MFQKATKLLDFQDIPGVHHDFRDAAELQETGWFYNEFG